MRRLVTAAAITASILIPAAPALAAAGEPQRPSGPFTQIATSANGRDNGFGNCGHNSSGGLPRLDGGNGGLVNLAKANLCLPPANSGGDDPGASGGDV
jgi:hypothetical protein